MCGRYSLTADLEDIQQRFELFDSELTYSPRYNIAPTAAGSGRYERRRETARVPALGADSLRGLRAPRWATALSMRGLKP